MLGLERPFGVQQLGGFAAENAAFRCQLLQHQTRQLTNVHARKQLLKTVENEPVKPFYRKNRKPAKKLRYNGLRLTFTVVSLHLGQMKFGRLGSRFHLDENLVMKLAGEDRVESDNSHEWD